MNANKNNGGFVQAVTSGNRTVPTHSTPTSSTQRDASFESATCARHDHAALYAELRALRAHLSDASSQVIDAVPSLQAPFDLELRLLVLDLNKAMERLACNLQNLPLETQDIEKKHREGEVLRLQRAVAARAETLNHGVSSCAVEMGRFGIALALLQVRLKLFEELYRLGDGTAL